MKRAKFSFYDDLFDFPVFSRTIALRECLQCKTQFESVDPADRVCKQCQRRDKLSQARPFVRSEDQKGLDEALDVWAEWCDDQMMQMNRRNAIFDVTAKARRKAACRWLTDPAYRLERQREETANRRSEARSGQTHVRTHTGAVPARGGESVDVRRLKVCAEQLAERTDVRACVWCRTKASAYFLARYPDRYRDFPAASCPRDCLFNVPAGV